MFDLINTNSQQQEAITASEGPVLITAGPGTGKTFTLVQRTLYLIQERGVLPENIFIATFTEKAARELITRISNELSRLDLTANININDMYIGTFHSICLRLLKEHLDYTRIRKNYKILDSFDQQYIVFQNLEAFRAIDGFDSLFQNLSQWNAAGKICSYVNNLAEEIISPNALINDDDIDIFTLGQVYETYRELIEQNNLLDFSSIMAETYRMLTKNHEVLDKIRSKISYIMVDEYQDTNTIQEQIIMLIAGG